MKSGKTTPEMIYNQMTGLTDSSRELVMQYIKVLVEQNPQAPRTLLQKVAENFRLLKFRGARALRDPDEKGMFNDACDALLAKKIEDDAEAEEQDSGKPSDNRQRLESLVRSRSRSVAVKRSRSRSAAPPSLFRCRSRSVNAKVSYLPSEYGVDSVAELFKTNVLKAKKYTGPKKKIVEYKRKDKQQVGPNKGIKRKGRSMSRGKSVSKSAKK